MNMNALTKQYAELVSLTQLFLIKEHRIKDFRLSFPKEKAFFSSRKLAPVGKKQAQPPVVTERLPLPHSSFKSSTPQTPDPQPGSLPHPPSPDPQPERLPPQTVPSPDPLPPTELPEQPLPPTKPQVINELGKTKQAQLLNLEPLTVPLAAEDYGFKAIIQKMFPNYRLNEAIPDDRLAKKLMNAWSLEQSIPPVIILSFDEREKHLALLKNIARAITLRFAPARVMSGLKLEKEKQWDSLFNTAGLRLIIASDYGLYLQPALMTHYREVSKQAKHFLNQTPLLLLSDLDLYLKEPQLKSLLWRAICNEFSTAPSSFAR
ncbi:conserved hypothetical protein [Candidatus Protochlamydia naegleriophila]|uniref:Uncharacterized protein n=1 Tax=Candidatus Protochlamydia naegleriophila TaxID=389348 RepID=A0A0U5K2F4_9BACT|nr:hypothetical protein [Candidatus Protochlamydia naegleriophila]CUI16283.1 conserved hypothetical protein [Candidatus Protochlamydia naegleriophila]